MDSDFKQPALQYRKRIVAGRSRTECIDAVRDRGVGFVPERYLALTIY
ncbi:hypothetical protein V1281_002238 [Nitrobacteraceae bacterium AZCC 2161]